jgi:hypothetical protein
MLLAHTSTCVHQYADRSNLVFPYGRSTSFALWPWLPPKLLSASQRASDHVLSWPAQVFSANKRAVRSLLWTWGRSASWVYPKATHQISWSSHCAAPVARWLSRVFTCFAEEVASFLSLNLWPLHAYKTWLATTVIVQTYQLVQSSTSDR